MRQKANNKGQLLPSLPAMFSKNVFFYFKEFVTVAEQRMKTEGIYSLFAQRGKSKYIF